MTAGAPRKRGSNPEFERRALEHAPAMYRLAARLIGNASDAEEVAQDAFIKALTALRDGSFEEKSELKTWLFRITANVALDRLRQRRLRETGSTTPDQEVMAPGVSPEARVALRELSEAMQELPDEQRAALVLKELEGLSTREVALVLERSEGATEQLLVRARQALRRRFES